MTRKYLPTAAMCVALSIAFTTPLYAQQPCYTAAQCGAIRQQAQQQQAAQAAAIAAQQDAIARQQRVAAKAAESARIQRAAQQQAADRQAALDLAAAEAAQRQDAQDRADAAARAQAERDAAVAKLQRENEDRASAQLAAENSPDNHCKQPKIAGELMVNFNNIQLVQDYNVQSVDIEHLTTIRFDIIQGQNIYVCHGVFVLMNGRHVPGTLATRINVAGNVIVRFTAD
jgi:multidrug efflux pump subunit AcrA (membrane-fusion protein)